MDGERLASAGARKRRRSPSNRLSYLTLTVIV
jgi:hypothetical protein